MKDSELPREREKHFYFLIFLMSDFKTAEISDEEEDGPLEISDLGVDKQLDLRKS